MEISRRRWRVDDRAERTRAVGLVCRCCRPESDWHRQQQVRVPADRNSGGLLVEALAVSRSRCLWLFRSEAGGLGARLGESLVAVQTKQSQRCRWAQARRTHMMEKICNGKSDSGETFHFCMVRSVLSLTPKTILWHSLGVLRV